MAKTHTFKNGSDRYGYYAYIEDNQLVIGIDWPREGGTLYRGTYKGAGEWLDVLKKEQPVLYRSIVDYYDKNPEVEAIDPAAWVENKLRATFQRLEVEHRYKADEAYAAAMRTNSTGECETFSAEYELNRKLSETYRLMALRAREYADQFSGA